MQAEAKKYLYDIHQAAQRLTEFTAGKRFEGYERDAMLRAAVERQLEIIGEALAQLAKLDQTVAARISEYSRVIAFRNILIHGYAERWMTGSYGTSFRPNFPFYAAKSKPC